MKELKEMTQLTTLWIGLNKITDAGLMELKDLNQLRTLDLTATRATKKGIAELRKALPKCKIKL